MAMWIIRDDSVMLESNFVQKGTELSRFAYNHDGWCVLDADDMERVRDAVLSGRCYVDLRKENV